jgi:Fe(3+) dicitrate transport protein
MKRYFLALLSTIIPFVMPQAQQRDSIRTQNLKGITITGYSFPIETIQGLESIHKTYITSGKKNEVIQVQDLPANLSEKTGRQIFAKIPGAYIYDMDGSGNQVNISTRGLDPHRSWEYNVRQNGTMTNSDIYGYPASHYSPPMESIQKIEIIRGTASLEYGSQFGGMINYVTKQADTTKVAKFESINSMGSYGLLSSFNAIGGKIGKLSYYAYYQKRVSDGYRKNARSDAQSQFASLNYTFSPKFNVKAELGRSQYIFQIPGPLTDAMFATDPRQSTRSRNYFNPDIYIPSLTLDWQISPKTKVNWTTSAVLGVRNSVQFIGFANVKDEIDPTTLKYKPRQVDTDHFHSYSSELRLQQDYKVASILSTFILGLRYTNNDLHRQQLGKGTTGTDFDLTITIPTFGRDMHFKSQNTALFIENLFRLSKKLEVSAGLRMENGESKMSGIISYLPAEKVPQDITHQYPLLGINGQYQLNNNHKIYGGWSQAYRPVVFADIIPGSVLEQSDPDLKDGFGYNAEIGFKGTLSGRLTYDFNVFQVLYQNRIGSLVLTDASGQSYIWKTNIGDSKTNGVELYAEYGLSQTRTHRISIFTATSYFDGYYLNGKLRNGTTNTDLTNNRLETVPKWISRNGLQVAYKMFSSILQYSYVSESFSDALNTVIPTANGASGIVPEYSILDLNMSYRINAQYLLRLGINNITDKQYFTKRPTGYPGQGVWSSDGRSIVVTFGIKI